MVTPEGHNRIDSSSDGCFTWSVSRGHTVTLALGSATEGRYVWRMTVEQWRQLARFAEQLGHM